MSTAVSSQIGHAVARLAFELTKLGPQHLPNVDVQLVKLFDLADEVAGLEDRLRGTTPRGPERAPPRPSLLDRVRADPAMLTLVLLAGFAIIHGFELWLLRTLG